MNARFIRDLPHRDSMEPTTTKEACENIVALCDDISKILDNTEKRLDEIANLVSKIMEHQGEMN